MAFHGKVALVTGAGSGMGRLTVQMLAKGGADVAALDVNEEGLKETAEGLGNVHIYPCDVTDLARIKEIAADVEAKLGTIDRVVHAAAIMPTMPVATGDPELIKKLMRVNYDGTVNIIAALVPAMLERDAGDFIIYGSIAGSVLAPHFGPYGATKAATNVLVEVLIHENLKSKVRFLMVKPPMVNTPLIEQATGSSNPQTIQEGLKAKRFADPQDIVDAIEKGIEKGVKILYPDGESKFLSRWRRYAPRLLWKVILKSEGL